MNTHSQQDSSRILPVIQRSKKAYLQWHGYYQALPKVHRFSLGHRIDSVFIETIEAMAVATFLSKEERLPYVRVAIKKVDVLKILLMILWESKSLDSKKYIAISEPLDEIGKMLGGWNGQLTKQNSPTTKVEEK